MDPGQGVTHQRVGALSEVEFAATSDGGFTARRAAIDNRA